MNSTPGKPALIIVFTALPPPPPTPTTLIRAPNSELSSNSIIASPPEDVDPFLPPRTFVLEPPDHPPARRHRFPESPRSEDLPKQLVHPVPNAAPQAPVVMTVGRRAPQAIENETDAGRVHRARYHIDETTHRERHAEADGQVEDLLRQLRRALEHRRA